MRSVTFVNRLTLNFKGQVNSSLFADVDNDGEFELCIGNSLGQIGIFKGSCGKTPWRMAQRKSPENITALCQGDLLNAGRNVLVAISADGILWLFDNVGQGTVSSESTDNNGIASHSDAEKDPLPASSNSSQETLMTPDFQ